MVLVAFSTVGHGDSRSDNSREKCHPSEKGGWVGCVSIALLGGTEHRGVELTMRRVLWVVGWECIGH